jgi:hypothetical protein
VGERLTFKAPDGPATLRMKLERRPEGSKDVVVDVLELPVVVPKK